MAEKNIAELSEDLVISLRRSREAIIGRGGKIGTTAGFADFPTAIYNIPADNAITTEIDDTSAFAKSVPAYSTKYAYLAELGGMTYRDAETDTLRDTKVTEIVSKGKNLCPVNSISTPLPASKYIWRGNVSGSYVLSWSNQLEDMSSQHAALFAIYFADGTSKLAAGTASRLAVSGEITAIEIRNWTNPKSGSVENIQFEQGTKPTEFAPYRAPISYPIPAKIQALEGYGADGFNIDLVAQAYSYNEVSASLPTRIEPLIEVEGGGTIEFVNEYGYAVPSKVIYQKLTQ
jgi:hypothetical protein